MPAPGPVQTTSTPHPEPKDATVPAPAQTTTPQPFAASGPKDAVTFPAHEAQVYKELFPIMKEKGTKWKLGRKTIFRPAVPGESVTAIQLPNLTTKVVTPQKGDWLALGDCRDGAPVFGVFSSEDFEKRILPTPLKIEEEELDKNCQFSTPQEWEAKGFNSYDWKDYVLALKVSEWLRDLGQHIGQDLLHAAERESALYLALQRAL